MEKECWLPCLEFLENYNNDWKVYESALYKIFTADFIDSKPTFEGKQINIRKYPFEYNREEAYFHVTCKDYTKNRNRAPDFRRCERIRWIRSFIENYKCDPIDCPDCDGIKVWEELRGTCKNVLLLLEEERYLVIIECRKKYCLLTTAFYLEEDHELEKRLKRYAAYRQEKSL